MTIFFNHSFSQKWAHGKLRMVNQILLDANPAGIHSCPLMAPTQRTVFLSCALWKTIKTSRNSDTLIWLSSQTSRLSPGTALMLSDAANYQPWSSASILKGNFNPVNPRLKISPWFPGAFWKNCDFLRMTSFNHKTFHDLASFQVS